MSEEKGKNRGEGLVSSSVSKNYIYNPRSRPRPRKTEEKDLEPRLVLVSRPLEKLCLKACWDDDVETCNRTVQFLDASGNPSNYTNPNHNNKNYTMVLNCKLRLNSAYFGICLFAWILPPVLLATSYVWVEVHTWASSKSPGEGVQFFFQQGGPDFSKHGGARGRSLQKFSLEFHRVIQINKKYRKIGHLLL